MTISISNSLFSNQYFINSFSNLCICLFVYGAWFVFYFYHNNTYKLTQPYAVQASSASPSSNEYSPLHLKISHTK